MGALCSCCKHHATVTSINTSNEDNERQAMLNGSADLAESVPKIKAISIVANDSSPLTATYGATSYTPLKDKTGTNKKLNEVYEFGAVDDEKKLNQLIEHDTDRKIQEQVGEHKEAEQHILISSTNLVIANAGYDCINGDYRWFVHSSKWCLFGENSMVYAMDKDVDVKQVYAQLTRLQSAEANFRWNADITKCWIISNMDGSAIYYAAPQTEEYEKYIPNNRNEWISVHGSLPSPEIYMNLIASSGPPDKNEKFGNVGVGPSSSGSISQKSATSCALPGITESNHKIEHELEENKKNDEKVKEDEENDEEDESLSDLD